MRRSWPLFLISGAVLLGGTYFWFPDHSTLTPVAIAYIVGVLQGAALAWNEWMRPK